LTCVKPRVAPLRRIDLSDARAKESTMTTLEIILITITFIVPAVCIFLDDAGWQRK
jgi:hypothetical protein